MPACLQQHAPGRGRCLHDADVGFFQHACQRETVGGGGAVRQHYGRANGQRREQFQDRNIETQRRDGEPAILLADAGCCGHAQQEVDDRTMGDRYTFGLSRRARGVDNVCNVVRPGGAIEWVIGPLICVGGVFVEANSF